MESSQSSKESRQKSKLFSSHLILGKKKRKHLHTDSEEELDGHSESMHIPPSCERSTQVTPLKKSFILDQT